MGAHALPYKGDRDMKKPLSARFGEWFVEDLARWGKPLSDRRAEVMVALASGAGIRMTDAGLNIGLTKQRVWQIASAAEKRWSCALEELVEKRRATRREVIRYCRYVEAMTKVKECEFLDCEREPLGRKRRCIFHYGMRASRRTDLSQGVEHHRARIMRHVVQGESSECWEWTGCIHADGFPWTRSVDRNGKSFHRPARRAIYELDRIVPNGFWVVNSCRNQMCVNPRHIIALPAREAIILSRGSATPIAAHKALRNNRRETEQ